MMQKNDDPEILLMGLVKFSQRTDIDRQMAKEERNDTIKKYRMAQDQMFNKKPGDKDQKALKDFKAKLEELSMRRTKMLQSSSELTKVNKMLIQIEHNVLNGIVNNYS